MSGPNTMAITARVPKLAQALIATANTDRTGASGTVAQLKTGNANYTTGTDGALLVNWKIACTGTAGNGTSTAGNVRLFASDGTTKFLLDEIAVTAISGAAGTAGFAQTNTLNISLPTGYSLFATTEKSETFAVSVNVLDY